ncbi:acid phosphatase [Geosmithia morbida]|uniref:Acid phosphatase n=1 Tax=Geosmithia morbida TaxID=1094350 RepID=A0A9P4YMW0_9HYPO|nr:acid phosphatase [Geosmithia morbida]KAF4119886.1 acid phosphatase [Geosmithia morbida]
MIIVRGLSCFALASLVSTGLCKPEPEPTSVKEWATAYTASASADVAAAAATAKTSSPTSHVRGKAFQRFIVVYFENEDYDKAAGDANFSWLASKGITLTSYHAVTHPSEPNYAASVSGDHFGMQNDDFNRFDANVSTVIDLLEDKGISWAHYQEDMPYSGFEGNEYKNQENGANDYVRKHNPAILYDSVAQSERRLSQIKNISMVDRSRSLFHQDLEADRLPQWAFITPNMTSDGHDTSVTVAGEWARSFVEPLLNDDKFMQDTLLLVTWDENETHEIRNRIHAVLLGDAVPRRLVGTQDDTFYSHYSEIATVEANWDLHTLGRWDVGANVFKFVAEKTGDRLREWRRNNDFDSHFWNSSYAGFWNTDGGNHRYPKPNLALSHGSFHGRTILPSIVKRWEHSDAPAYYQDTIEIPDGLNPPKGYEPVE